MVETMQKILDRIERGNEHAKNATAKKVYGCEKCKDTEWILTTDESGLQYATHCTCWEKKAAKRLLTASGISEEDSSKGSKAFDTFGENALINAKETASRYYSDFLKIEKERVSSIILCGASGRGKTTLGMAISNNLIHRCIGVRYMPYRDEITRLKQEVTDEYAYNAHIGRLKNARVLFIDDMLKGRVTESDTNILYEVINHRYLARLPLIISTEKTTQELLEYDEAIGSRLLEMSKGYIVEFDKSTLNYRLR